MELGKNFIAEIARWPQVSVHPHRFGGQEFRLGAAEVGHVHEGGTLDIPFSRAIRDLLLSEGLALKHHWVPDSGWVTFHIRGEQDVKHALWLMRLSYIRYAIKTAADPQEFLGQESQTLRLSPKLRSLIDRIIPRRQFAGGKHQDTTA